MEKVVYADVLFFINFSMDFITLWASALVGAKERRAWRMCLGAFIGGAFGVIGVLMQLSGALSVAYAAAVSVLMCIAAFGGCGGVMGLVRQSALVWGCGALLGGLMTLLLSAAGPGDETGGSAVSGGSVCIFGAIAAFILYFILRLLCRARCRSPVRISLSYRNRKVTFEALCDSGNLVQDPVTGDPVMLLSRDIGEKLLGERLCEKLVSLDAQGLSEEGVGLRIVPRVGAEGSRLTGAIIPDKTEIYRGKSSKRVKCLAAITDGRGGCFGGYTACAPSSLLL